MKILIWDKNIQLKNTGGPAGYLFNLHQYLSAHPCENIHFYSDHFEKIEERNGNGSRKKVSIIQRLRMNFKPFRFISDLIHLYYKKSPLSNQDKTLICKYDAIHVHSLYDYLSSFASATIPRKIILTTHTPEPLFDELVSRFGYDFLIKAFPSFRNFFLKRECAAYKSVDYIMLPVKDAEQVYTNNSKLLERCFSESRHKMFYVPTSLYPSERIGVNHNLLKQYKIPDSALVLCYIGRHNEVKGYKSLQQMAENIWREMPNVYFIIGGKEEPIKGLKEKRWIELGWVNTPDLLQEVDAFILPNKNTYFDIILLEVLREGKMSIISSTGGNKWFLEHPQRGIWNYEYDNFEKVEEICNQIIIIKESGERKSIEDEIHNYFNSFFSASKYISNYIESLNNLNIK